MNVMHLRRDKYNIAEIHTPPVVVGVNGKVKSQNFCAKSEESCLEGIEIFMMTSVGEVGGSLATGVARIF